ncbi:MAG TPA: hypothetical protein VE085_00525 [Burkholderiales bacterium]|nr:hypothetical protein [Burkholderiales bacterium]
MKRTLLSVLLVMLAASACTSLPEAKGPFARSAKGATQTDAGMDDAQQPESSPFPQNNPFGN